MVEIDVIGGVSREKSMIALRLNEFVCIPIEEKYIASK